MRIHEVVLSPEVAGHLQFLLAMGKDVVLLGREFGGARIVTAALPVPGEGEGWDRLRALRHGPIGILGAPPGEEAAGRLLPGDILMEATPDSDPSDWRANVLEWTGPADETVLRQVPITVA